jgi:uncharacterized protein
MPPCYTPVELHERNTRENHGDLLVRGTLRMSESLTLEKLRAKREEILQIAARRGASKIRVFGSIARGEAGPDSDVDLIVELDSDRTVLDLSELILDLEEALGRRVDVVELRRESQVANEIERQAVPL